jgi:hypothetical protein
LHLRRAAQAGKRNTLIIDWPEEINAADVNTGPNRETAPRKKHKLILGNIPRYRKRHIGSEPTTVRQVQNERKPHILPKEIQA